MKNSRVTISPQMNRKTVVLNMDPANDRLPYEAAANLCELVDAGSVASTHKLGPNGSLLYAMEFLQKNMHWLEEKLKQNADKYILFDFPGQIELYTHNDCIQRIVQRLVRLDYRVRFLHPHLRAVVAFNSLWSLFFLSAFHTLRWLTLHHHRRVFFSPFRAAWSGCS